MADIELVIKIPEEVKQAFDCAESNDLKGCYYDHGGVIGNAIKNGTPLPKYHGDLKDADELKRIIKKNDVLAMTGFNVRFWDIDNTPIIIPATNAWTPKKD